MSNATRLLFLAICALSCGVSLAQDSVPDTQAAPSADDTPAEPAESESGAAQSGGGGVKTLSGMSILGNEEAPKSLVIVPWKSSELGDGISVRDLIDERARPVDKEVFLREIRYFQLRSGTAD